MRVRWGRVMATGLAVPVVGLVGWWATGGEPSTVARRTPGAEDCDTSEVLGVLSRVHHDHPGPEGSEADRAAAAILVAAARCERLEEVPIEDVMGMFHAALGGTAWLAGHEPPARAVADLLDVWELASDQRRAGPLVSMGVWNGVGLDVSEVLAPLLADPRLSEADRAVAAVRLRALATAPLDWGEVAVREERSTWGMLAWTLSTPAWWPELVRGPVYLYQARYLSNPIVAELEEDVLAERTAARVLAEAGTAPAEPDVAEQDGR